MTRRFFYCAEAPGLGAWPLAHPKAPPLISKKDWIEYLSLYHEAQWRPYCDGSADLH